MNKPSTNFVSGLLGIAVVIGVVYGLSYAISRGFAKGKESKK